MQRKHLIDPGAFDKLGECVGLIVRECNSTSGTFWGNEINKILLNVEKLPTEPPEGAVVHSLKIHPQFFKETVEGKKNNEIRLADRPFAEGDWLKLEEWNPQSKEYTGAFVYRKITYITKSVFGLERYWVLSLQ